MTDLNRNVRRRSNTYVRSQGKDRRLVIELRAGSIDTIFIKEEGRRIGYTIPFTKIYQLGARIEAEARIAERKAKRKSKKEQITTR